jgi:hypothetical protein
MIAKDKRTHLVVGFLVSLFVSLIASSNGSEFHDPLKGCIIGFLTGTALGVGKELIWDKLLSKGTPEFMDAVYTIIGALSASILLYITLIITT